MIQLNVDKKDCKNAAELMEMYFFQNIRDDEEMDNIEYIRSLLNMIDELKRVSQ